MSIQNGISQICILKLKFTSIFANSILTLKYLFFIVILLLSFAIVNAQQPYAIHLSKVNGLPSNSVYNVFQDSKGFIWLATNAGLTRYDGFEFKTYQCDEQTSAAGSSINEDALGRIWYENFDGYLYYIENDRLKALKQNKPIGYIPIGITKKHLFIIQKEGIEVYDLATLRIIKTIRIEITDVQHSYTNENTFFFIINKKIYAIDYNLNVATSDFFKNKSDLKKQIYGSNDTIFIVSKCNEEKSTFVFSNKLKYLTTLPTAEPDFIQGGSCIDNKFWIHTASGSFAYNTNHKSQPLVYFKNKSISCVIKDRQNNYWFCTTNEGVFLVPNIYNSVHQLNGYLPNKIVEIKNDFIIATKKSELLKCDKLFNINGVVNKKTDNAEIYYLNYDSTNNSLFYSSKGFTHIANLNYKNPQFYDLAVKEISKIDDKFYAIATSGFCGLMRVDENDKSKKSVWDTYFLRHKNPCFPNMAHLIDNVRGKSLAYNIKTNTLYFATNTGLYKYTPNSSFEIKLNENSFYASKIINYNDDIYALSTKGNLFKITPNNHFTQLNKLFGITDFDIKLIKQFDDKLVFVSQKFVHVLNLKTNKLSTINININEFEINDILLIENTLYLITNSGIIKTSALNESYKTDKAILQLNEFIVNGKKLNPKLKNNLKYNQNDIIIHFSVLDFGTCNQNKLFYKINDDKWQPIFNETRMLQFASLASGNYNIKFKLNNKITSNTLEFTIATPFWQTAWFTLICILLTLLIVFIYYRGQLTNLRNKNKLLHEKNKLLQEKIELESNLNKSVLKTIKAQMNPHFFYNALNTIQAYIFTNDKTKANNYLAKFSKLTRVILEHSEKETISLAEEIESLTLYLDLEKIRFNIGFEFSIELKIISNKDSIEFPPMLIQPYVENSIKHGLLHKEGEKHLTLLFEENKDSICVTIDDNGIGRKRSGELNKIKNEKYQSFSSKANEKRLEILNEHTDKIAVKIIDKLDGSNQSLGTKVVLTIPTI